jgi:hypothetical protein
MSLLYLGLGIAGMSVLAIAVLATKFGLKIPTVIGGGVVGSVLTYVGDAWSSFTSWLQLGVSGSNLGATLYTIGFVCMVLVIASNLIATSIDKKPGVKAIR